MRTRKAPRQNRPGPEWDNPDPGGPLSDREKAQIKRVLGEPMEYPLEMRSWIKNYIETVGIQLPRTAIVGLKTTTALYDLPAGMLFPYAGSTPPPGTLSCNGDLVRRDAYPQLFTALGTTWGAGDGLTTFRLPDLRDRRLVGAGGQVGIGEVVETPAPGGGPPGSVTRAVGVLMIVTTGLRPGTLPES